KYSGVVEQVPDASQVVKVCNELVDPEKLEVKKAELKEKQERMRTKYLNADEKNITALNEAREQRPKIEWTSNPPVPECLGVQHFDKISLDDVIPFIDWSPFFWAWGLKGVFPKILDHAKYGEESRKLFKDAEALLQKFVDNKMIRPKGVFGFWPAHSSNEDVILFKDEARQAELERFQFLRQQAGRFQCLADYVSPVGGPKDYLGAFVVTAGKEVEELALEYKKQNDDFNMISTQ